MNIINSKNNFNTFINTFNYDDFLIILILENHHKHHTINRISMIYFYSILTNTEYMLPFNHPDVYNLTIKEYEILINSIKNSNRKFYILNKKIGITFLNVYNLIDVLSMEYYKYGVVKTNINIENKLLNFYRKSNDNENLNLIIPILKHIEYIDSIKYMLLNIIKNCNDIINEPGFININNIMIITLNNLEKSGIYVDPTKFNEKHLLNDNYIYTNYNMYTSTGRPSTNNFNFLSLNKKDGSRKFIISRFKNNGKLIYIDYSARHLYLIADILNEKFKENPYLQFGKIFFNKNELSTIEYDETKKMVFNIIYGNINIKLNNVPILNKIKDFIDNLYYDFNSTGYIITPLFKKKIYNVEKLNKHKIFNYYMQAVETENGINTLNKLFKLLNENNAKSKIILYVYDAFLIDYNIEDGKKLFDDIINVISNNKYYPIKITSGNNYHDL